MNIFGNWWDLGGRSVIGEEVVIELLVEFLMVFEGVDLVFIVFGMGGGIGLGVGVCIFWFCLKY